MTEKQRKFVEAYMGQTAGNATEAARLAGYGGDDNALAAAGSRLLRNAKVQRAVQERQEGDPLIATREERQQFWSAVLRATIDAQVSMADRLKASELLGKAGADFIDRTEGEVVVRFETDEE